MDLTIYQIIQGSVLTTKAQHHIKKDDKLVLQVHPAANKVMIKHAVEKLFNVKVIDVNTIIRKGKSRTFKRMKSTGSSVKRAIITIQGGAAALAQSTGAAAMAPAGENVTKE